MNFRYISKTLRIESMTNGGCVIVGEFKKGLSDAFISALGQLAEKESWWRDVLRDRDLLIGVRNEYLNVYWQGQSIFRVWFDGEAVQASTHPKYLLNPALSDQVAFDWKAGQFKIPANALLQDYQIGSTLKSLKSAAGRFSGGEKQGVHVIARDNPAVIDVEIALNAHHLETTKNLPRIDIAALESTSKGYELVFWEAKLFANKELRAQGDNVPILDQVKQYKIVLDHYRDQVVAAYTRVAQNLLSISNVSGGARQLGDHIRAVAEGAPLSLGQPPRVGVVVFDFDADQRKGDYWAIHAEKLRQSLDALGDRLLLRGQAKGLALR